MEHFPERQAEAKAYAELLKGARIFVSRASFPTPDTDEYYWVDLIGLHVVNREGVVLGEVRGLEMCRVVDDSFTGEARVEVGLGAHDREAFAMVHGHLPTEDAMRQVITAVQIGRAHV